MSTRTSAACCSGTSCRSAARTSIAVSLHSDGSAGGCWPVASASSVSSSWQPVAGRAARRRIRSRAAFTTILCSQVVTAESPRKWSARRNAAIIASCRASAASSGSPSVRTATAQSRSRCRPNSSPNASLSPATCLLSSSASDRAVSSAGAFRWVSNIGVGSLRLARIASLTSMRNKHASVIGPAVDARVDPTGQRGNGGGGRGWSSTRLHRRTHPAQAGSSKGRWPLPQPRG
jgi:hypothetical protein